MVRYAAASQRCSACSKPSTPSQSHDVTSACSLELVRKHCTGEPSAVRQHKASSRRELLTNTVAALSVVAVSKPLESAEALPFGLFEPKGPKLPPNVVLDRTLSYTFIYPLQTASGKEIPMVASRKPEKYSSAAPLVADARQRIVAEYVSLAQGITCSMFVGPVTGALQRIDQSDWTANDVAQVVLSDRSAVRPSLQCHHSLRLNRNYAGQKLPVASVENARTVEKDRVKYYMYETVQSGSPTLYDPSKNTARLGLSVTAARPGMEEGSNYLYTLSLACPNVLWDDVQDGFRSCIDSYSMLPPTDSYIPPDKDPWKFI